MAESRPTATSNVKATTSVQANKSSNAISWLAHIICVMGGYVIWRYIFGNADGFTQPDPAGGFWPAHKGTKTAINGIYEGGIIVPLLIGMFLMVIVFSIERFLTISKALGKGN